MAGNLPGAEFILLTGPLGSGKTTLLVDYLRQAEAADTGVIVNEAGAINVDGAVLSTQGNGTALAHLPNGCICCSVGNDLHGAVAALMAERAQTAAAPLRRIILETSGLAYPGPILRSMAALPSHAFRVRILTTYDALAGLSDEALFPTAVAQLAVAQAVVVTKAELVDGPRLERVTEDVAQLNPLVKPIIVADRADRAVAGFSPPPVSRRLPAFLPAEAVQAHPRVRVLLAQWDGRPEWQTVSEWLDALAFAAGDKLLRVKGLLDVADCADTLLVESVGTVFGAPRRLQEMAGGHRGIVVILRDMERQELQDLVHEKAPILEDTTEGARPVRTNAPEWTARSAPWTSMAAG